MCFVVFWSMAFFTFVAAVNFIAVAWGGAHIAGRSKTRFEDTWSQGRKVQRTVCEDTSSSADTWWVNTAKTHARLKAHSRRKHFRERKPVGVGRHFLSALFWPRHVPSEAMCVSENICRRQVVSKTRGRARHFPQKRSSEGTRRREASRANVGAQRHFDEDRSGEYAPLRRHVGYTSSQGAGRVAARAGGASRAHPTSAANTHRRCAPPRASSACACLCAPASGTPSCSAASGESALCWRRRETSMASQHRASPPPVAPHRTKSSRRRSSTGTPGHGVRQCTIVARLGRQGRRPPAAPGPKHVPGQAAAGR